MVGKGWQVTVLAFHDGSYYKTREIDVTYVEPSKLVRKFLGLFKLFSLYRFFALSLHVSTLRKQKFSMVIGVDSLGFLVARMFFSYTIYFSLHIRSTLSGFLSKMLKIERLIIQTPQRLDLMFSDSSYTPSFVWFIQNSPILGFRKGKKLLLDRSTFRVIYFGNIVKNHYGIENCIESLRYLPHGVSLTLKGPISRVYLRELRGEYSDLIASGRLTVDTQYVPQREVISWLAKFDLGLCFYDEREIRRSDPNIISAPSGKMFNYLAAELPVIGSKVPGLGVVEEFNAGILLVRQDPKLIAEAAIRIRDSHTQFQRGCRQAALCNDFEAMANYFLADFTNRFYAGEWQDDR